MRLLVAAAIVGALIPAQTQQTSPQAQDLAKRVQAHYDSVRDFTADFNQSSTGGVVRQSVKDHGTVKIKKPGRMWWDYKSSQKQQVVADGAEIYTYLPDDRKLYVSPLPKPDEASSAMLFLTGRGDLLRDFTPILPDDQPAGSWRLTLVPKTPQTDFTSLTLVIDRTTLALQGLMTTDQSKGVTTYTFSNLKENVGLADKDFIFNSAKLPKDVEVIR
jgi:outer membrane lipoprotein carrier protein